MKVPLILLFFILFPLSLYAQIVGSDYDGDGLSDAVAFENQKDGSPNELATTWISSIDSSLNRLEFGKSVQSSVPADYDGDGITDYAIVGLDDLGQYLWKFKLSKKSTETPTEIFGKKDDLVLYGCDFDDDLKADRAVIDTNGLITYQKSADLSLASFTTLPGIEKIICADIDGDGIDEIIAQKQLKVSEDRKLANKKKKKKKKNKKPGKQPAKETEKSFFYVWNIVGQKILDTEFGKDVKSIFAADTDGNGIKEFGYEREKSKSAKEAVFYNAGQERVYQLPYFNKIVFQNFTGQPGADGFFIRAKSENKFIRFTSLADLSQFQEFYIPRADTVISNRGTTAVGPIVSKETICNINLEPNDGNEGFLWKPVSDTTGNLVVVLPKEFRIKKLRIIKNNQTLEDLSYASIANGNRQHWRSYKRASSFEENITVTGAKGGVNYCWFITDPNQRFD